MADNLAFLVWQAKVRARRMAAMIEECNYFQDIGDEEMVRGIERRLGHDETVLRHELYTVRHHATLN